MNFETLKLVLQQLKEKGYINAKIYKDHAIIAIKSQTNGFTNIVTEKIHIICESLEDCYYKENTENRVILFLDTKRLIGILENSNKYEEIQSLLQNDCISYISRFELINSGVNKRILLHYGNRTVRDRYNTEVSMKYEISSILYNALSQYDDIEFSNDYLRTKKATDYEKRKKCCQSIKIEEDFDKIFEKYL